MASIQEIIDGVETAKDRAHQGHEAAQLATDQAGETAAEINEISERLGVLGMRLIGCANKLRGDVKGPALESGEHFNAAARHIAEVAGGSASPNASNAVAAYTRAGQIDAEIADKAGVIAYGEDGIMSLADQLVGIRDNVRKLAPHVSGCGPESETAQELYACSNAGDSAADEWIGQMRRSAM